MQKLSTTSFFNYVNSVTASHGRCDGFFFSGSCLRKLFDIDLVLTVTACLSLATFPLYSN